MPMSVWWGVKFTPGKFIAFGHCQSSHVLPLLFIRGQNIEKDFQSISMPFIGVLFAIYLFSVT